MTIHGFDCQKAVVSALTAANLCGGRIYDDAPATVTFPWIEIGDRQIIPDDSTSNAGGSDDGVEDFFDIHVWSRTYAGKKEVEDIIDSIHGALHGVALIVAGQASAIAWFQTVRVLRDPDGITRHGIVSLQVIHRS